MIWLGSIAWDGYPDGLDPGILVAATEKVYVERLTEWLKTRTDYTHPEQGWPWPWDDSSTTDYAYTFVVDDEGGGGDVMASSFGNPWFDVCEGGPVELKGGGKVPMPNMKAIQNVDMGERSGLLVFGTGSMSHDLGQ